jgi:hypothetical protein
MKSLVILSLFLALGATGAKQTVNVGPSNISFKDAMAACPSGTLGALSLSLGHVRIAESADVESDIDYGNVNAQSVTFTSGSHSATALVNASKSTVSAKHVTLASRNRVACVAPDQD